jgi:hypothetical protein
LNFLTQPFHSDTENLMIPQEKTEAVTRGLREAFGVPAFEEIRTMTRGLGSALKFRIVVRGSPYLLKILTRINEMNDPARQFTHIKAAAEAGLAPHVWYTSLEDGICITDFVEAVPLPTSEARVRMPGILRRLHGLPPFPKAFNYVTAHKGFIWRFRSANLLFRNEVEEVFTRYDQVCAVYPRLDADMVSCHNDLKPENILFNGQHIWLADWEASLLNDRYFDLAIVANFVVESEAEERVYLQDYFGQAPDEYERARFFLMRQVLHLLSAAVFLMLGSAGKPIEQSARAPEFRGFHRRIWAGEINLADNEMKIAYGRVHWEQLSSNMRQARFHEALRIVSDRHAGEGMQRLLPFAQ